MKKNKKRAMLSAIVCVALVFAFSVTGLAAEITDGRTNPTVTLSEANQAPVFSINVDDSNLFIDFDNVMPGDTLTQVIDVRTTGGLLYDYNIYLYAVNGHALNGTDDAAGGAHSAGEHSADLLEYLTISVRDITNTAAPRNISITGYTDSLGLNLGFFSRNGTTITLEVTVTLDIEAGNEIADTSAYIDWVFTGRSIDEEEPPVDPPIPPPPPPPPVYPPVTPPTTPPTTPTTPTPETSIPSAPVPLNPAPPLVIDDDTVPLGDIPKTGDGSAVDMWSLLTFVSGAALIVLIVFLPKKKAIK